MVRRIVTARQQYELLSPWRTAERADRFEWQRSIDGDSELATFNPDGNRVTIPTAPSRGQHVTAGPRQHTAAFFTADAGFFSPAVGYYDPERELREAEEHRRWLRDHAEALESADFAMSDYVPSSHEEGTNPALDRLRKRMRDHKERRRDPSS